MVRGVLVASVCLLLCGFTPVHDPSGSALEAFHRSLSRTARGVGQTRILQYGASHTEADLFTGYLRQFFQHRFGDAGHGWVMPARPWRGYRHLDVHLESTDGWFADRAYRKASRNDGLYGLAGFSCRAAESTEWAKVGTSRKSAFGARVSRFELAWLRQPSGGSFDVLIDSEHYATISSAATETGLGMRTIRVTDGPHDLEVRPRGDGEVRLLGVVLERGAPGVVVDTLGIRGARASVMLQWNEELWAAQVRRRAPDLIMLAYGTNESGDDRIPIPRYEATLHRVIDRLKGAVPRASCLLIGPTDRPIKGRRGKARRRPRVQQIVDSQRRISAERGCAFWDMYGAMGGPLSIVRWRKADPKLAQDDLVHLTARGYYAMADDLAQALLDGYQPR